MQLSNSQKQNLSLFNFDEQTAREELAREITLEYVLSKQPKDQFGKVAQVRSASELHVLRDEYLIKAVEKKREAFEVESAKYLGYSSVYELADRVLTNQDVSVVMRPLGNAAPPAQSDGTLLVFNTSKLNTDWRNPEQFILGLHGLNLHEVAHVLFTPRGGSELAKWVMANGYRKAFNYLEDNRIENLLVAKYPSVANFLTLNVINNIVNAPEGRENPEAIYPLIAGRSYLPVELHQDCLSAFVSKAGTDFAKRVHALTTEFSKLVLPRDSSRAKEIIIEFAEMFNLQDEDEDRQGNGSSGDESDEQGKDERGEGSAAERSAPRINEGTCCNREPMRSGRPQAGSEQDKLGEKSRPNYSQDELDFEQPDKDDSRDSEQSDSDQSSEQSDSDQSSEQSGNDSGKYESLINDIVNSQEVQTQVRNTVKAVNQAESKINTLAKASFKTSAVSVDMRQAARKFADELIQSEIDADPAWLKQQPSGRLNVQRTMNMTVNDMNTVFDRWTFNDQTIEVDAAVLIDNSGSMSGLDIFEANKYAWVLKRAVESINGTCSVLCFSTYSKRVYDSDERATATEYRWVPAQQDTQPLAALNQARIHLTNSDSPIRVVFILTDGAWAYARQADALIKDMQNNGIVVVNLFLSRWAAETVRSHTKKLADYEADYGHGADVFALVPRAQDLAKVARDVLLRALENMVAH